MPAPMVCMTDEATLLSELRAGNDAAYQRLLQQYGGRLLGVARRFMGNEHDALDAFQDAMVLVVRNIARFEAKSSLYTWMYRIVANACLTVLRKRRPKQADDIDKLMPTFDDRGCRVNESLVSSRMTADALLERGEVQTQVRAAIEQLPESYRIIVLLRDIDERSTQETADLLNMQPGAVRTKLHRARAALKKLLDPVFAAHTRTGDGAGCP